MGRRPRRSLNCLTTLLHCEAEGRPPSLATTASLTWSHGSFFTVLSITALRWLRKSMDRGWTLSVSVGMTGGRRGRQAQVRSREQQS